MNFGEFLKQGAQKAVASIGDIFKASQPEVKAQETAPAFDRDGTKERIRNVETSWIPEPIAYRTTGITGDLGKYQANPKTVKDWSKAWLGKDYSNKDFLSDARAQEEFMNQFLNVAERLNLTPDQTAIAWHRGWGELGTGKGTREDRDKIFLEKLAETMQDEVSQKYLKKFNKK